MRAITVNENIGFQRKGSAKQSIGIGAAINNKKVADHFLMNRYQFSDEYDQYYLDIIAVIARGIFYAGEPLETAVTDIVNDYEKFNYKGKGTKTNYFELLSSLDDIGFYLTKEMKAIVNDEQAFINESSDFKRGIPAKSAIGIGEFSEVSTEHVSIVMKIDRILKEKGFIKAPIESKESLFPDDVYTWARVDPDDLVEFIHASLYIFDSDHKFNLFFETESKGINVQKIDRDEIFKIVDKLFYDEGFVNESIEFQRGGGAKTRMNIGKLLYKKVERLAVNIETYGFKKDAKAKADLRIGRYKDAEVGAVWTKEVYDGTQRIIIVETDYDWYVGARGYDNNIEVRWDFTDKQGKIHTVLCHIDQALTPGYMLVNFTNVDEYPVNESIGFQRGRSVKGTLEVGNEWIGNKIAELAKRFDFGEIDDWRHDNMEGYETRYFENEDIPANITLQIPNNGDEAFVIPRAPFIDRDETGDYPALPAKPFTDKDTWKIEFDIV